MFHTSLLQWISDRRFWLKLARSWFQIGHYQWLDDKISGLPNNRHIKRSLPSTSDDRFISVYRQVLYDFVGWLATHLQPNLPYSRQANDQTWHEAVGEGWISGHHAVVKMADFSLIDWFHCSALAAVIVAAMLVFWPIFQPDLTGQYFANPL
jgi:hypothetical protein